ncbi:hypothetical protein Shyhy02_24730 [Streptomyces hygroscopicus subsp. hygroscopicus]|nr:hypothetical protein Shyhy02_24730 [Streptomyces hygroscopicus subsp. hygroscopicus]
MIAVALMRRSPGSGPRTPPPATAFSAPHRTNAVESGPDAGLPVAQLPDLGEPRHRGVPRGAGARAGGSGQSVRG